MAKKVKGFESPEPGNLPKKGADLLAKVYADCREKGNDKEKCAKIAWSVVKKAGYKEVKMKEKLDKLYQNTVGKNPEIERFKSQLKLALKEIANIKTLKHLFESYKCERIKKLVAERLAELGKKEFLEKIEESQNFEEQDGRPPKAGWEKCIDWASGWADDPSAVCGDLYFNPETWKYGERGETMRKKFWGS